ncbi:MAG TPA: heme lyase CcmF/NrfE family subunit [Gemmatimonadaceae bacterium]|nr:heme lyase CcmF/NrfE family subunit [Gemmatimonadaceae bacterium]
MTRLLGFNALVVALGAALYGSLALFVGARRQRAELIRSGRIAVYAVFGLATVSTLAMIYALVAHDFSVDYVARVGSRATPLFYTVISLWGALEGSILFWLWVLTMLGALVVYQNRERPGHLVDYTGGVMLLVTIFFLILLVGPANPFGLVSPVPPDGPGPNPLLQNHWLMGVHPPLLYLGYVGMTVPFAFAIGAVLSGEISEDGWIRLTRRWTLLAWMFLTAAIVAGMWWSYEVLGWGGYWAWDPVENASFLPWLTATAFLHSVMVQERRGLLKLWNLNLIVATFTLTILGTFLTRSGVLASVHAFTTGTIGWYFLAFIGVVLLAAFAVVAGNSDKLRPTGALDAAVSRESVFLLNNLFLTAFTITVLVGTLFPLVAEAVRGVKVSVGEPFFNRMTLPICAALLFLMGVGPALPWRRASREVLRRQLLPPAVAAGVALVASLLLGVRAPYALAAFAFGAFALTANVREFVDGAMARRRVHGESPAQAVARLVGANRRRYGGYIAHIGVLSLTLGVAASSTFRTEREATLRPGETMQVGDFAVRLDEVYLRNEPQRDVLAASVTVLRGGREIDRLEPRMNFYPTSDQPVPTPDVRSRLTGDLYLNLQAFARDGSTATIRAIEEPLVPWIWIGGFIVCLGALVSAAPNRRRVAVPVEARERAVAAAQPPARELEGVAS